MISKFRNNQYYFAAYLLSLFMGLIVLGLISKGDLVLIFGNARTDLLTFLFSVMTIYGEVLAYLTIGVIMLLISFRNALKIALIGFIVLPTVHVLKWLFANPRPYKYFELQQAELPFVEIEGVDKLMGFNSFPSGHTTGAFALSTMVALNMKNKKLAVLWLIPAIGTGLSRIYLSHHFLEDVVFGSVVGVLLAFLCDQFLVRKELYVKGRRSIFQKA